MLHSHSPLPQSLRFPLAAACSLVLVVLGSVHFVQADAEPHKKSDAPAVCASAQCPCDTPAYEHTVSHLEPGEFVGTFELHPWQFHLYRLALLASRIGVSKVDTVFISHSDTTALCWSLDHPDTSLITSAELYETRSILGDVISYSLSSYGHGGAHPTGGVEYHTLRLEDASKEIKLTAFFPPDDVLTALLSDPTIRRCLDSKSPRNLDGLIQHLEGNCQIDFASMLTSWCISEISSDSAVVEFGLPHQGGASNGLFTTIQVTLRIPARYAEVFRQAREAGTVEYNIAAPIN